MPNIRDLIRSYCFVDFGSYQKTVILAGSGRSGTTWVANLLNWNNKYRLMFEPFKSKRVSIISHFLPMQYIRPDNREVEKFNKPVERILSGRLRNIWIDNHNKKIFVTHRLIKEIRINLMLKWIKKTFPEISIVFLLRHPCAVACSRIALGWDANLERVLAQKYLIEDHFSPFLDHISKAQDNFEKQIYRWCIENFVPLKQFKPEEIHISFYENFCYKPNEEIKDLFNFLCLPFNAEIFNQIDLLKPSAMTRIESAINLNNNLIESWKNRVTEYQIQQSISILTQFGLDRLYSMDSVPNTTDKYHILNS